jgi:hypothetical protein
MLETVAPQQPLNIEHPFVVLGGFGYDERRNATLTGFVRSLGHTAIDPLPNPSLDDAPKGYTVRYSDGTQRIVRRQFTYLLAPKPEVILISSQQQEERGEELNTHIERQVEQQGSKSTKVNVIAQSADAQNTLIAARRRPELFNSIALVFPAGMVKKRTVTEYTRAMIKGAVRHRGDKHLPDHSDDFEASTRVESLRARRAERRFAKSGGFAVAASVAVAYQNELLTELRQREDAPSVSLVLALKDSIMQPERLIESLNSANDVDCIHITNTKHGINGSKKMLDDILKLFPVMEEIKAKHKTAQDIGPLAERVSFAKDVSDNDRQRIIGLVRQLDARSTFKPPHLATSLT